VLSTNRTLSGSGYMSLFTNLNYFRILHSEEGSCLNFLPIEDDLCTHLPSLYIFCTISGFSLTKLCDFHTEKVLEDDIYTQRDKTSEREKVHDCLFKL
jgi:hypothetical protein